MRYTDPSGHCIEDLCIAEAGLYASALAASPDTVSDAIALGSAVDDFKNSPNVGNGIVLGVVSASMMIPGVSAAETKGASNIAKAVISGKYGEQQLAKIVNGGKKTFNTSLGRRVADGYDEVKNIAHEAKTGYTTLTKRIERQIQKDVALVKSGTVNKVEWHFYTSPITGKGGLQSKLEKLLKSSGIKFNDWPKPKAQSKSMKKR